MSEEIKPNEANGTNPTFDFIRNRVETAPREVQELVTKLILEKGSRREVFIELTKRLRASPKKFQSVQEILNRDKEASAEVSTRIQETARRDAAAMRPDKNLSSTMEWFFLTIPSIDIPSKPSDWKRLSETIENLPKGESGVLTLQSVIQNVLNDEPRTRAFILEVIERVKKMREEMGRPLTIYDVGCGPFPVLAIAAAIAAPDSKIICIEKNPLSAKVAEFMVDQLGMKNQVTIHFGDALDKERLSSIAPNSIDLLITETFGSGFFDEPALQIFQNYSQFSSEKGETIPARARVYATLLPTNKGVTYAGGQRREKYKEIVLNTAGDDLPVIPAKDWKNLTPGGIDLRSAPENAKIKGILDLPKGVSLEEFQLNYNLCLCLELDLGKRKLKRYSTFPTFPIRLDSIFIPPEIMQKNPDPKTLQVEFSYEPGSSSSAHISRAKVVEKA